MSFEEPEPASNSRGDSATEFNERNYVKLQSPNLHHHKAIKLCQVVSARRLSMGIKGRHVTARAQSKSHNYTPPTTPTTMSTNKAYEPVRSEPIQGDYELIDVDPHFNRVVSYFRASDYGAWAASTAAFPLSLIAWEKLDPAGGSFKKPGKVPGGALRVASLLGFCGGFYLAYIRSSKRFLGWSENAREVKMDRYEIKKLLLEEKLPYHENESSLDDRMKDVSNRNSQYSFTAMAILPWFNLSYHPYHGVDIRKYYETRPGEETWGFDLKPFEDIKKKYAAVVE